MCLAFSCLAFSCLASRYVPGLFVPPPGLFVPPLGVILYELLAGSPPLDARQFKRGAVLEMLRMVREVDPPRPSTRVSTAEALPSNAASRDVEPAHLKRALQGDLDWIVMKALEKDRNRRYETANGFAADILRHLAYEPVR